MNSLFAMLNQRNPTFGALGRGAYQAGLRIPGTMDGGIYKGGIGGRTGSGGMMGLNPEIAGRNAYLDEQQRLLTDQLIAGGQQGQRPLQMPAMPSFPGMGGVGTFGADMPPWLLQLIQQLQGGGYKPTPAPQLPTRPSIQQPPPMPIPRPTIPGSPGAPFPGYRPTPPPSLNPTMPGPGGGGVGSPTWTQPGPGQPTFGDHQALTPPMPRVPNPELWKVPMARRNMRVR